MLEPFFSILLPLLGAYNSVAEFRHSNSFGRYFVAKWPPLRPKVGVTRAIFQPMWKQSVSTSVGMRRRLKNLAIIFIIGASLDAKLRLSWM